MNPKIKNVFALLIIGLSSSSLLAFDNPGHMAVAGIAFDELTATERTKVVDILKKHPDLLPIKQGFPKGFPSDRNLFMAAATWPDLIRSDSDYRDVGYEEDQPAVKKVDRNDKVKHRGYHFIDTPLWLEKTTAPVLPKIPAVNAVGVVEVLVTQIKSREDDVERAFDLMWLMHLVGDLHQPLHAVTGYSSTYPDGAGDRGGNLVTLVDVKGETELHAYWDDILGKAAKTDPVTHLRRLDKDIKIAEGILSEVKGTAFGSDQPDDLDPAVWAQESYQMAKDDAYDFELTGDGETLQVHLDEVYAKVATQDAKERIRLAGHRLALLVKSFVH